MHDSEKNNKKKTKANHFIGLINVLSVWVERLVSLCVASGSFIDPSAISQHMVMPGGVDESYE